MDGVRLFCDDHKGGVRWPERRQGFAQSDGRGAQRSSGEMPAARKLLRDVRRTVGAEFGVRSVSSICFCSSILGSVSVYFPGRLT